MFVPVMDIREMRVGMLLRRVTMPVRVGFAAVPIEIVRMLMVFVMAVRVRVFSRFVTMAVLVAFG